MDSCWSVPLLSSASTLLLAMPSTCFGVVFVLIMEEYGTSREGASWPESVYIMTGHLSGLGVALLQRHTSLDRIILLSSALATVAVSASAFAPNMLWMIVTFGALQGFAYKVFITSVCIYSLMFFTKYRTTAQSFINSSWGTAGTIGPIVLSHLMQQYGFKGALLLYGGIIAHAIPVTMLLKRPRPLSFLCCRRGTAPEADTTKIPISITQGVENRAVIGPSPTKQLHPGMQCSTEKLPVILNSRTLSPEPESHIAPMPCTGYESSYTTREATCKTVSNGECIPKGGQRKPSFLQHATELSRNPAFYALVLTTIASDYCDSAFLSTIVDYGRDKGIAFDNALRLASFSSLGRTVGSTVLPILADAIQRIRSPLYVSCLAVTGSCLITMPLVVDFSSVAVVTVVFGLAAGYLQCAKYLFIAQHVGVERTAACFGFSGLGVIPLSLAHASIIGFFRDAGGSYDNFYRTLGAMYLFVMVLLAIFYLFVQRNRRGNSPQGLDA